MGCREEFADSKNGQGLARKTGLLEWLDNMAARQLCCVGYILIWIGGCVVYFAT